MSPKTLEAIIAEHNALQPANAPQELPAGTKAVIVAKAGRYNDHQDKAHDLVEGDTLITRPWYASYLVESGQAGWPAERAMPEPEPEPEPEPSPKPRQRTTRKKAAAGGK